MITQEMIDLATDRAAKDLRRLKKYHRWSIESTCSNKLGYTPTGIKALCIGFIYHHFFEVFARHEALKRMTAGTEEETLNSVQQNALDEYYYYYEEE